MSREYTHPLLKDLGELSKAEMYRIMEKRQDLEEEILDKGKYGHNLNEVVEDHVFRTEAILLLDGEINRRIVQLAEELRDLI